MNKTSFTPDGIIPTTKNSNFVTYDLESLSNAFTLVTYDTQANAIAVFFHIDPFADRTRGRGDYVTGQTLMDHKEEITQAIIKANPALADIPGADGEFPRIYLYDLTDDSSVRAMVSIIGGLSFLDRGLHSHDINTPEDGLLAVSGDWAGAYRMQLICDTSPRYNPSEQPFILGYNSYNYDTTMLALYLSHRLTNGWAVQNNKTKQSIKKLAAQPLTEVEASTIRDHNDGLFDPEVISNMPSYLRGRGSDNDIRECAGRIRYNWLSSGRHVDIARLNELQSKVALKRLLGQMGHQILESDRLSGNNARLETYEDAVDLLCYNVSDVVGTWLLFQEFTYVSAFDLRSALMRTYPEVVFNSKPGTAVPDIDLRNVKGWRHRIDTSSAQFAGSILAPYSALGDIDGHLADLPVVSLRYPDEKIAEAKGTTPANVLTETRNFVFKTLGDNPDALEAFEQVYTFYRHIEGLNFNTQTIAGLDVTVSEIRKIIGAKISKDAGNALLTKLFDEFNTIFPSTSDRPGPVNYEQDKNTFTSGELAHLLDQLDNLESIAGVTSFPKEDTDVLDRARRYLRLYYTAIEDSNLPFNPADDPAPGQAVLAYPPVPFTYFRIDQGIGAIAKTPLNLPYYGPDGASTGCFATFSTGGVHGAEYNSELFAHENAAFNEADRRLGDVIIESLRRYEHLTTLDNPTKRESTAIAGAPAWGDTAQQIHDTDFGDHEIETLASAAWFVAKTGDIVIDGQTFSADQALPVGAHLWPETDADGKLTDFGRKVVIAATEALESAPSSVVNGAANFTAVAREIVAARPRKGLAVRAQAIAAYTLRKVLSVELSTDTGDVTVTHDDVIMAASKANTPWFRTVPKGMRQTPLFQAKISTKTPVYPEDSVHRENKLNPRYSYTSVDDVIHEDFTSYYPRMLTNMAAFVNPDLPAGEDGSEVDRYSVLFDQKEAYGREMKDPDKSDEERALIKLLREGVKLILNSASGAADAGHKTQILMNNRIIAMRIIGQLLTWRVGQAQSSAGARIVSTNTDGLYSTLDEEINNRILAEQTDAIGVEIEPEPLTLVSKDANNRVEFFTAEQSRKILGDPEAKPWERVTIGAGGASLACYNGPNPQKALSHAAISDYALVEYFKYIVGGFVPEDNGLPAEPGYEGLALAADQPMNAAVLRELILPSLTSGRTPAEALTFYQHILASSTGSHSYVFAADYRRDELDNVVPADDMDRLTYDGDRRPGADTKLTVHPLQHYNRVFYIDPERAAANGFDQIYTIASAKAKTISETVRNARDARGNGGPINNHVAKWLLEAAGEDLNARTLGPRDLTITKHSGVSPVRPVCVVNQALKNNPDDQFLTKLMDSLDLNVYVEMIRNTFNEVWRNRTADDLIDDSADQTELAD